MKQLTVCNNYFVACSKNCLGVCDVINGECSSCISGFYDNFCNQCKYYFQIFEYDK